MATAQRASRSAAGHAGARRAVLGRLAATLAAAVAGHATAGSPAPLSASVSARKVAGNLVRTTVYAKVSLPGLAWSGALGTWDVPAGGRRELSAQPTGLPARFRCTLTHVADTMQLLMIMEHMMAMQQQYHAAASAKVG
ncbi:MAG: hypothetical protein JNJ89_00560 [Rubrivivax sp.]|nr:hypothetical protein [Rubrivivax sp.]